MDDAEPHDAHVQAAHAVFRKAGFTLAAMQYPRSPEALAALKRFNGMPEDWEAPFAWGYYPNEWCRQYWTLRC